MSIVLKLFLLYALLLFIFSNATSCINGKKKKSLTLILFPSLAQVCVSSSLRFSFAASQEELLFAVPSHPLFDPCHPTKTKPSRHD